MSAIATIEFGFSKTRGIGWYRRFRRIGRTIIGTMTVNGFILQATAEVARFLEWVGF
jgi:hypothetical protein